MPPPPPIWLDNNVLVKIDNGRMPNAAAEIAKLQKDGHEVLLPPSVEREFLHGEGFKAADTVRREALLTRLGLRVDTMVNRVPMQQLQAWRNEAIHHGLSIPDAVIIAQVRASASVRGIRNPALLTGDIKALIAMRQRGVLALEFKATPVQIPPHLTAPTPNELPMPPVGPTVDEAAEAFFTGGAGFRAGLRAGLKELLTAESIAAMVPDLVLVLADRFAARDAVRKIRDKFTKEGFAKGVAAGVMGWSENEVALNLMNHVTNFRLEGLGDPGGLLSGTTILKLAEAQENYAVGVGFRFGSSKPIQWKRDMQGKGMKVLHEYGYYFGANPEILFEYPFLKELAWALQPTTDSILQNHGHGP